MSEDFVYNKGTWVYIGDINKVTREVGDTIATNETNPLRTPNASATFAKYIVSSSIVLWQKSWEKIQGENIDGKLVIKPRKKKSWLKKLV